MKCTKCLQDRHENDFHWRNRAKGVRKRNCRFCHKLVADAYYSNNKEKAKQKAAVRTDLGITDNCQL